MQATAKTPILTKFAAAIDFIKLIGTDIVAVIHRKVYNAVKTPVESNPVEIFFVKASN